MPCVHTADQAIGPDLQYTSESSSCLSAMHCMQKLWHDHYQPSAPQLHRRLLCAPHVVCTDLGHGHCILACTSPAVDVCFVHILRAFSGSDGGCRCPADIGIGSFGKKNTTYAVSGFCSLILPIDCHHHLQYSSCNASACTVARDVASTPHDMEAGIIRRSTPQVEAQ